MAQLSSAPFRWMGAKGDMAPTILEQMPPHDAYIDVFGGAGTILWCNIVPGRLTVYNDLNSGLVNFMRVLRTPKQYKRLVQQLQLTPYSREEYLACMRGWALADDPVEKARQFFVAAQMAFGGNFGRTGWAFSSNGKTNEPCKFRNNTEALARFARMLAYVQVENYSFEKVFKLYDSPGALFYADPPYLPEARRDGRYTHEMTVEQHELLLHLATTCQGMCLISGYASDLYDAELAGWRKITREVMAGNVARTAQSGYQGAGALAAQGRTECLWIKPNTILQPRLFTLAGGEA